jgi:preprotein translocase subunit SecY
MLQKNGAFVPGIRPGVKTQEYLDFTLERVTFIGALFLISVCVLPSVITKSHSRFEGTSLLIMVSVAMRVMMNIQTQLYSDKYESAFKSKGKYNGPNARRF